MLGVTKRKERQTARATSGESGHTFGNGTVKGTIEIEEDEAEIESIQQQQESFPEEIEDTLRRHPAVADAAVVGVKSQEWGEAIQAFVVLHRGAECNAAALIQFCKESLAAYKAPKVVAFLSALPRTGLGKIDRGKLERMNRTTQR